MPSKRNVAVGVAGVVLLAGIAVFVLGQPSVSGVDNRFGGVNETTTVVESDLTVRNPTPIGASLGGLTVDYAIDMNGIRMATGVKQGLSLPSGESTVPMTTHLANERIPAWWVSHLDNGERTELAINADVHSSALGTSFGTPQVTRTVETDVISAFNSTERRPVGGEGPTGEPILYIEETSAQWGAIDSSATEIDMRFVVYNPNPYPVPVSELSYRATMNGVAMGAGATEGQGTVPPESTRTIRATTVLDTANIDKWWVTHIENGQRTELRIDFSARIELPTGTVEIPLRPLTYTETIETDIFGSKDETDADDAATPTQEAGVTPTSTSTSDEETTTPTPIDDGGLLAGGEETTTPTSTADEETTTPTPTDDGLLDGGEETATPTPADDGRTTTPTPVDDGLLDARPPHGSIRVRSDR